MICIRSQVSESFKKELAEAFNSWYGKRRNGERRANPPGYRKHGDDHPRSTVTFKAAGFKLDTQYNRVRLSKGSNLKAYWSDFTPSVSTRCGPMLTSPVWRTSGKSGRLDWREWELYTSCPKVKIDVSRIPW